jgi:hypothetical protein
VGCAEEKTPLLLNSLDRKKLQGANYITLRSKGVKEGLRQRRKKLLSSLTP